VTRRVQPIHLSLEFLIVKRIGLLVAILTAVVATTTGPALAQTRPSSKITFSVLKKSGPHTITRKQELVTFFFKINGMTIDKKFPGKKVKNAGHVQIYLDKVPADAYRKKDLTGIASVNAPGAEGKHVYAVTIQFDNAYVKEHIGTHTLKIGLARNNMVMYRVPIVSFPFVIKKVK
jgi:hypothetical protein